MITTMVYAAVIGDKGTTHGVSDELVAAEPGFFEGDGNCAVGAYRAYLGVMDEVWTLGKCSGLQDCGQTQAGQERRCNTHNHSSSSALGAQVHRGRDRLTLVRPVLDALRVCKKERKKY